MGTFIDAETLKARSRVDETREMDTEDIEDILIRPAEAVLEEAFGLDLTTDGDPEAWVSRFDNVNGGAALRTRFQGDMKSAMILLCDRMNSNPHGLSSQGVRGSSVTFGKKMPMEVKSLLARWSGTGGGKNGRVFR